MTTPEINITFDPLRPWSLKEADAVAGATEILHPCRISLMGGAWVSLHELDNREYMIVQSAPTGSVKRYGVLDRAGYEQAFEHFRSIRSDDSAYPRAVLESIEKFAYYDSDSQHRRAGRGFDSDQDYSDF